MEPNIQNSSLKQIRTTVFNSLAVKFLAGLLVLVLLVLGSIRALFFHSIFIDHKMLEPAIMGGDYILVRKKTVQNLRQELKLGDFVMYQKDDHLYLRRLIAFEGDRVDITNKGFKTNEGETWPLILKTNEAGALALSTPPNLGSPSAQSLVVVPEHILVIDDVVESEKSYEMIESQNVIGVASLVWFSLQRPQTLKERTDENRGFKIRWNRVLHRIHNDSPSN